MFALFSLDLMEIIILGLVGLLLVGVPVVVLLVLARNPKPLEPSDDEPRA
jgi:hypothetical protein